VQKYNLQGDLQSINAERCSRTAKEISRGWQEEAGRKRAMVDPMSLQGTLDLPWMSLLYFRCALWWFGHTYLGLSENNSTGM